MKSERELRIELKENQVENLCRKRDKQFVLYKRTGKDKFLWNVRKTQKYIDGLVEDIQYLRTLKLTPHI